MNKLLIAVFLFLTPIGALAQLVPGLTTPLSVALPDVVATGQTLNAATLNAAYNVQLTNGRNSFTFTVRGLTASGATLTILGSQDGVNYTAKNDDLNLSTITVDERDSVNVAGLADIEIEVTTVGTGTITIDGSASVALADAATATLQTTGNSSLSTIAANTAVTVAGTPATSGAPIQGMTGGVPVPVSLATLPGFTATPTVNLGTLGGAATATNQAAIQSAPGTPQTMAQTIQGNASGVPVPVSLATLPALVAGSAVAGKFGIDQTTPGTTNNVTVTPQAVTVTWAGGSVTTGGAFQSALATSSSRKGCQIQNTSSGIEYVNSSGSPTVLNANQINPYGTYTCNVTTDLVDQAAIEISGATTGQTYVVASW